MASTYHFTANTKPSHSFRDRSFVTQFAPLIKCREQNGRPLSH